MFPGSTSKPTAGSVIPVGGASPRPHRHPCTTSKNATVAHWFRVGLRYEVERPNFLRSCFAKTRMCLAPSAELGRCLSAWTQAIAIERWLSVLEKSESTVRAIARVASTSFLLCPSAARKATPSPRVRSVDHPTLTPDTRALVDSCRACNWQADSRACHARHSVHPDSDGRQKDLIINAAGIGIFILSDYERRETDGRGAC